MRAIAVAVSLLFVLIPTIATGQTSGAPSNTGRVSLQVAAGPTVKYPGNALSAGLGFSPLSRLDLIVNVERLHQPTSEQHYSGGGFRIMRGGALTFVSGELRASLFPAHRVSPFVLAGIGGGVSRPNVNARFPVAVRNDLRVVYVGGGVRIPLRGGLSLLADARAVLALEGDDGIMEMWPLRAGLTWRF